MTKIIVCLGPATNTYGYKMEMDRYTILYSRGVAVGIGLKIPPDHRLAEARTLHPFRWFGNDSPNT